MWAYIVIALGALYAVTQKDCASLEWLQSSQERVQTLIGYSASNYKLNTALSNFAPTKGVQNVYTVGTTYARRVRARMKTDSIDPNIRRQGAEEIAVYNYRRNGPVGVNNLSYIRNV
jgi:hypothetical protein